MLKCENIVGAHDDMCVTLVGVLDGLVHLTGVHSMRCLMNTGNGSNGPKNGFC